MAQHAPGGNWSSRNPVPKVGKIAQHLKNRDRENQHLEQKEQREEQEKQQRDQQAKQDENRNRDQGGSGAGAQQQQGDEGEARSHPEIKPHRHYKKVTDPTTGRDVEIDDVDKEFMNAVKDPTVGRRSSSRHLQSTVVLTAGGSYRYPMQI